MSSNPIQNYYQCPNCTSPIHRRRNKCRRCGWGRPLNNHFAARLRSGRHKMMGISYRISQATGRAFAPCPDCRELIPNKSKHCRYCGWGGGYRSIVRPTLRHFLLRLINFNLSRSSETTPCPHCQWAMPVRAKRCPLCLRPPVVTIPEPIPLVRAWLHLRRRWVKHAARNAMICPLCSVQVPPWAPGCLCCGWERPRPDGKVAMMRYAFAEVKGEVLERIHHHNEPVGDLCPDCEVLIPLTDRQCMICGWVPDRKKTIVDAAEFLLDEIKIRGTAETISDLNLCQECNVPMPPHAKLCLVCGWEPPINNPILRFLRKKKVRKFRKYGPSWRPCPNCCLPLPRHSVKCMACGWEKMPTRYWGKAPRAIWVTMTVLVVASYFAFQYFMVLASGGSGITFGQDQYGRNRFERTTTTEAPPMTH